VIGLTYRQPIILSQDFTLDTDFVRLNRFEDYTPLSAADIADGSSEEWLKLRARGAKILNVEISDSGATEIASRSRGTPRIALRLLRRVRDFAENAGVQIDKNLADSALKRLAVDGIGLDAQDRKYLQYIAKHYDGGPVGVETIAAGLSEERDTLEETIEPFLLQAGLIQRTPRGRMLTKTAFEHLDLPFVQKKLEEDLFSESNS
jgi:Holliday junction DNA helicase RuvB